MNNSHSKVVGYILWIFGFMGAHRFYYGKPVTGVIWFCSLGVFFIGWLIDLFLIPAMDDEADQRFVEGKIDYSLAWILLTFLGPFGAHRLYMGKWKSGLAMLIVTLSTMAIVAFLPPIVLAFPVVLIIVLIDFLSLNDQINKINQGF